MIALYILLGIVLFFALIFSLRIKVYILLEDELKVRAGLGPVVLTVVPSKPKKPLRAKDFTYKKHQKRLEEDRVRAAKKAEKAAKKKADKAAKAAEKKKQAEKLAKEAEAAANNPDESRSSDKLETILSLVSFGVGELGRLASWLHTDVKRLEVTVGGPDAASVALNYGRISAAAAILMELLDHKTALRHRPRRVVSVEADFLSEKTVFKADMSFKLRLVSFLRIAVHALVWFIRLKISQSRAA